MLPIDALIGLYEIGQELQKAMRSVENPDVIIARDLLKILHSAVGVVNAFEESGEDTTNIRQATTDVLKGFDSILLKMCIQNGTCDKTEKMQSIRKGIQRQIELLKACPVEKAEIKQLERGVRHHETVVKAFSIMVADKSVQPKDLADVRSVLKTNLTGYRKRLNQLFHGPLAIRSDADSLSERCSKLLQSEIVRAK